MTSSPPTVDWEGILDGLSGLYGTGDWRVPYLRDHAEDPFQVLIGTILSQRTKDANTDKASAALFRKYPDARRLAGPPGRSGAADPRDRLLPGQGPRHPGLRAADPRSVRRRGAGGPRDPPDPPRRGTQDRELRPGVRVRPAERSRSTLTSTASRTVSARSAPGPPRRPKPGFARSFRNGTWIPINPLLVQHGQNLCRPRGPRCPECPIAPLCATGRALRAGTRPPRVEDRPRPAARPRPRGAG